MCMSQAWLMRTYTVRKSIKLHTICDFWKHPMSRIQNNCVFIQGNLKYKTWRTLYCSYILLSVCCAAWLMTHSHLKLVWIDSRFNPVWKLIPFERALNATQYYVNLTTFLYTAPEIIILFYIIIIIILLLYYYYIIYMKIIYIENCLTIKKKQLTNMKICSCRDARLNRRLNVGRTSQWFPHGVAYCILQWRAKTQVAGPS